MQSALNYLSISGVISEVAPIQLDNTGGIGATDLTIKL